MSSECFRRYPYSFVDSNPSLPNSVVAYKRHLFRNMASENSREALGVRHAFSQSWVTISNESISNTYLKCKMPFSILYFKLEEVNHFAFSILNRFSTYFQLKILFSSFFFGSALDK